MSTPAPLGPPDLILARYGELVLKGRNRDGFERRLVRNAKEACRDLSRLVVTREHGQLVLRPDERHALVARRLTTIFGLASISLAWEAEPDPARIAARGLQLVERLLESHAPGAPLTFRVRTRRADKRFPLSSMELDRHVGDAVFERFGDRLRAEMRAPEATLGIAVRRQGVYLFAESLPGAGGLPAGSLGKAVALLSGGIDSPVATWMAMRRGLQARLLTFTSEEFLGAAPEAKVRRLATQLARWQPFTRWIQVPFGEVQVAVRDAAPEKFRTVLYRRMMHRIAARVAEEEGAQAVVTGDSLGQVASQTLENLAAVDAISDLPVLRPLVALDKQETIDRARRIGTYELSIEDVPDCCTLFQPAGPTLRGTPPRSERAERDLDVEALVSSALERAKRERVRPAP